MAIKRVSQKVASCDNPRCNNKESTPAMTVQAFRVYLREKGWSVGRNLTFCPSCAKSPARHLGRYAGTAAAKPVVPSTADVSKILCNTWGECTICLPVKAANNELKNFLIPRYQDDDILYVREGWAPATLEETSYESGEPQASETYSGLVYRADNEGFFPNRPERDPEFWLSDIIPTDKWKSPMTLPREAVRLFLKVKNTRYAKIHNGKFFYSEDFESASKFDWNDLPWTEVITVERCDRPTNF